MQKDQLKEACAVLTLGILGAFACSGSSPGGGEPGEDGGAIPGSTGGNGSVGSNGGVGSNGSGGSDGSAGPGSNSGGSANGSGGAGGSIDVPNPPLNTAQRARLRVLELFANLSGQRTLAGIENKSSATPHSHTDEVAGLAGRTPSFWGADFGFGNGAVGNRDSMIAEAKRQWSQGAVVSLMYHTCVPTRDELCGWDDIGGAHPVHLTNQQWDDLFTPGTAIHTEWYRRLDILAGYFQELRDAGVAPLFRPFHEVNQCAFWWSCVDRPNGSVRLWKDTYDYLVHEKGQDHLVWTWNIQDFTSLGSDIPKYNPGADYFDLATLDIYNTGYTGGNYQAMLGMAAGKPIGIGECQFLPTLDVLNSQPNWTFFMLWPDFINEPRNTAIYRSLFASERVQTLDEMPGWE
ncbi:MAG TPA: glycosyl hydrolase [Polyangiaceae bacterium]|nr:glycosyl hydrolase [Polyangiaceae bacterium]